MKQLLTLAIAISTITALAFAILPLTTANAVEPGDIVVFGVPVGSDAICCVGDKITVTGAPTTTLPGGTCTLPGEYPVQQVIIRHPEPFGGPGLAQRHDIVILSQTTPLEPGTQLEVTEPAGANCQIEGIEYARFLGPVVK